MADANKWNYFHSAQWRWNEIYPKSRVVLDVHLEFSDPTTIIAKYSPKIRQTSAATKKLAQVIMFLSSALMPIAERQMSRFHGLCDDTMDNDDEAPLRKQAYGMLKFLRAHRLGDDSFCPHCCCPDAGPPRVCPLRSLKLDQIVAVEVEFDAAPPPKRSKQGARAKPEPVESAESDDDITILAPAPAVALDLSARVARLPSLAHLVPDQDRQQRLQDLLERLMGAVASGQRDMHEFAEVELIWQLMAARDPGRALESDIQRRLTQD